MGATTPRRVRITNATIAHRLRELAGLLEHQGASPFRVKAYLRAAEVVDSLPQQLYTIAGANDRAMLEQLPGIGRGIAAAIHEMLMTGRWSQLERLRGAVDPVFLFTTIPGVGPALARRIHDRLGVDTLEALEIAAYDGRLARVRGVGPRRLESLRVGLAAALGRSLFRQPQESQIRPSAAEILAIDSEYRAQAQAGTVRLIAPRRFNPGAQAWLPIMHRQLGRWHFTALYSNTARAHELGRTRDWVVIYYYDDDHTESQCTVVTETSGPLKGKRVVRGREPECMLHYEAARSSTSKGSAGSQAHSASEPS